MIRLALALCAFLVISCSSSVSSKPVDNIPPAQLPVSAPLSGEACGGMMAGEESSCANESEYCHRDIRDMCGAADAPGVCRERPQMCTMDYTPVCGCDGNTYPNECAANAKGISASYLGECKS